MRARHVLATLALPVLLPGLLTGCTSSPEVTPAPEPSPSAAPLLALPAEPPATEARQALSLVPLTAQVVTITDFDALRQSVGFPDLTSEDPMADRRAFWEAARQTSVLLTDGLLREDNSLFMLDYEFTQDDVDYEVRFTGPEGSGFVLGFRPDLDMKRVRRAVEDGAGGLGDAEVLGAQQLVVSGTVEDGEESWAEDPQILDLTHHIEHSTYLHRGCVPFNEALGPDAGVEDQQQVLAAYDIPNQLRPVEVFSVSFNGVVATGRLGLGRTDLVARTDLTEDWPRTGRPAFTDAFTGMPLFDATTGRVGLQVKDPVAAAAVTLTNLLPFAVCNEVDPLDEPTG
ncbi:hypothetical protein [Nocardioides sp.]|uniref:hypothetical protein n=1 Tax=Nocardioides sp. TaxID=35761 RepID=UPI00273507F1|nr:hypothetical protein [Nocardioides sp.]MDP3891205.1 hypothetical protein [Nocardioides sp.]